MNTRFAIALALATTVSAIAPLSAAPGGPIGTMAGGRYLCELPGDATGPRGVAQADQDFTITNASSYETAKGAGSYLLTGDILAMTSGPKRGQRFQKFSGNFLRLIGPDGLPGDLRCIRRGANG